VLEGQAVDGGVTAEALDEGVAGLWVFLAYFVDQGPVQKCAIWVMCRGRSSAIIGTEMRVPRRQPIEETLYPASATPMVVAVCGDPVVGRALVLLLQGPRYDVRFVPTPSLSDPGSLEGVQLVLLTLTWELNGEGRDALLASLKGAPGAVEAPILELTSSGGARNGEARVAPEHTVPWPCSTEELERRIQAALLADPPAGLTAG
jgi:hypothetical protein